MVYLPRRYTKSAPDTSYIEYGGVARNLPVVLIDLTSRVNGMAFVDRVDIFGEMVTQRRYCDRRFFAQPGASK